MFCGKGESGLCAVSQYFQFYYTISGVEERNTINSLCFKSLINKNVDLWKSQLPPPYWPVERNTSAPLE